MGFGGHGGGGAGSAATAHARSSPGSTANAGSPPLAALPADAAVSAFAFDPRDPNIVYVGTGVNNSSKSRVYKSTDAGEHWQLVSGPGVSSRSTRHARPPSTPLPTTHLAVTPARTCCAAPTAATPGPSHRNHPAKHATYRSLEFPRFRGHLSAWPVWAELEDGVHVRAEALHEAVSRGVSA
jgi:hypothetical protein